MATFDRPTALGAFGMSAANLRPHWRLYGAMTGMHRGAKGPTRAATDGNPLQGCQPQSSAEGQQRVRERSFSVPRRAAARGSTLAEATVAPDWPGQVT